MTKKIGPLIAKKVKQIAVTALKDCNILLAIGYYAYKFGLKDSKILLAIGYSN